jgi:uncharacterized membrane protein required for colicin V production
MTIWILALGLLVSLAALGYRQGAIRVAFSLIGIIISAMLAGPFAKYLYPILPRVGIQNPTVVWLVSPLIVFWVLMIPFKSVGFLVHHKVEMYYKYKAEGLQALRWMRLNSRLGLCLGPLNALIYLVLISFIIFDLSYWSVQVAVSPDEPAWIRLLNRLGRDSEATGFVQIARAMDPMPDSYFQYADLAGFLIQNPQLSDRLASYPMFISLTERDDFSELGRNTEFQNIWKQHAPVRQLLDQPQFKSIRENQETVNLVWGIVQENFDDLFEYLKSGKSARYSSLAIVGRWDFNIAATTTKLLESRPVISSREMRALRASVSQSYTNTTFIAGADRQAFLKSLPHIKVQPVPRGQPAPPPVTEIETWQGRWKQEGNGYELALSSGGKKQSMPAHVEGTRLTIKEDRTTLVFDRQ